MISTSRSRLISIIIQVLIWLSFGSALFLSQPLSWGIQIPTAFWVKQGITVCLLIAAYYINSRVLVPKLLLKHRVRDFLICITVLAAIVIFINDLIDPWLHIPELMDAAFHKQGPPRPPHKHGFRFDTILFTVTALILGVSTSITAVQKWQADQQSHQELKQEKTDSELSFLKAQINPHFFFNTLNNIYTLTLIDVATSRQALHQLSRMMRYVLYETQYDTTILSKEVAFIKDYIELMRLRLTEKVTLQFQEPDVLKDLNIAPMLFLPFIENAFKHGVSATQNSKIIIQLEQKESLIDFKVSNTIVADQEKNLDGNSGIGLANTKRRLDLLYPDKYNLNIENSAHSNQYSIHLTLQLS